MTTNEQLALEHFVKSYQKGEFTPDQTFKLMNLARADEKGRSKMIALKSMNDLAEAFYNRGCEETKEKDIAHIKKRIDFLEGRIATGIAFDFERVSKGWKGEIEILNRILKELSCPKTTKEVYQGTYGWRNAKPIKDEGEKE